MPAHIGQDLRRRHHHFVLETRLMHEKSFRDAWLRDLCDVVIKMDEPMCKSLGHQSVVQKMFRRKVACFRYNQLGLWKLPYHLIPSIDHKNFVRGNVGTRDWVPYANYSSWTMNRAVRGGELLVHRVYHRGWGTCPHLNRGGWKHRWNKVMQRNVMQYTRV
jgi:hypothetical protein